MPEEFEIQWVKIDLSPDEVELFKFFREKQDEIIYMRQRGFWDFKKGQAICHRDDKGKLRKIDFNLLG